MVHLYNGVLHTAIKNNKFMKFLGKWMDMEDIILSEVTQSQKQKLRISKILARRGGTGL